MAGIGCLILCYVSLSARHYHQQLKAQLAASESELKRVSMSEQASKHAFSALQKQLHHAIEDPVTHLLGWELFADRLQQNLQECIRYQLTMSILIVDINDFAVINNALGQAMGDAVLSAIASCLQTSIRKVDSVSRYKKDIFAVLLPKINKPEAAAIVAQRLLQSLAEPIQVNDQTVYVTANIGISIYPTDGDNAAALLQRAEDALQVAKQHGQQHYQFYHQPTHVNSEREYLISMGLKNESLFSELQIHYQPIMDVGRKQIFCVDAVLYWHHPVLGVIEPNELQDHITRQGNENKITEWLLRHACQQFKHWRALGFEPGLLGVTFSIKHLQNSQFIYHISQVLKEYDFKPEWLLVEMVSHSPQHELEMLEKTINMLQYLKVKLAINDFCAIPLSIHYLKKFPVHYAKIDPSCITDIEQSQQTKAFVEGMLFLARSLGIQLIVQGIQSEQQVAILSSLGCRFMQGHFVGASLPEQSVEI